MPLCDAYIPMGVLEPEVERKLVARVTRLLINHEMRRISELMNDPAEIEASRARASAIAWTFVHRTEIYVAGEPITAPVYRFVATVPEGQIDDQFAPAVNRDIFAAVAEAEAGRWPQLERRLWVTIHEVYDGRWGAGGRVLHLKQIIDVVSPGYGESASARFEEDKRKRAAAVVALARTADFVS